LGETFRCYWDVPNHQVPIVPSSSMAGSGPFPSANDHQLTFIAEQVRCVCVNGFELNTVAGVTPSARVGVLRRARWRACSMCRSHLDEKQVSGSVYRRAHGRQWHDQFDRECGTVKKHI
jgi:hypothetical protein